MMQKHVIAILSTLLLGVPTIASCMSGRAYVVCENGQHAVSVTGWYSDGYDVLYEAVVFKREAIGVCEPSEFLPVDPLPLTLQPYSGSTFTFETSATFDVPSPGVAYRYTPYGVLPDGSFESMYYVCDNDPRNYAIANCNNAPIARGRLEFTFECSGGFCIRILPCGEDCWTEPVMVHFTVPGALVEFSLAELLGQVVDVYGVRSGCAMPGGDWYAITRMELAPSGLCGPVPVQEMNWGGLKATYR
jgi:hypothetical protein